MVYLLEQQIFLTLEFRH
ncbi:hypothetical protein TNIN_53791, partial [Trichonephila inaurata madagascariensis]